MIIVAPSLHMLKHFKGDLIQVRKNEPIEMPAEVTGLPMPKIEWLKDDVVIAKPTENLLIETKEIDRVTSHSKLSIPSVTRLDKGTYTVTALNRLGSLSHSITVEVLGKLSCTVQILDIFLNTSIKPVQGANLCKPSSICKQNCSRAFLS